MKTVRKFRYPMLLAALLLLSALCACSGETPENPMEQMDMPALTVTVAGVETGDIPVTAEPNEWNGAVFDRVDTLTSYREDHWTSGEALPLVPLGSTVELKWSDRPPDEIVLHDNLLDENGFRRYTDKEDQIIDVELAEDEVGRFVLEGHFAAYLSSNSEDYLPGNTYRYCLLVCTWGDNQCEYVFAFRTDAQ